MDSKELNYGLTPEDIFQISPTSASDTSRSATPSCAPTARVIQTVTSPVLAWSQVLVAFLLVFNGFGYSSSFGIFESHWKQVLTQSSSDISWVGSVQLFLLFFVGTLSGRLMDAGYFRSLIIAGCSLQLIGVFTTSGVTKYWQLILAQGIVQGIGNGLLFTPLVTLVSLYFPEKRAFALGVSACGSPVGGVIFPTIARQLMDQISYPWIIRVMGFVMLFNTSLILILARPKALNRPKAPWVDLESWRELPYALFGVGIFFVCWGIYFAYFYTTTFGTQVIGVTSETSLSLLEILNGVGVPGRLIPALLADMYFGSLNLLIPFALCCGILLFSWIAVSSFSGFVAFVVVYGICANAVQTLFPSALANLNKDMSKMGVRIGMVFTIVSVACLTGPPIAGVLISHGGGSYRYAQIFGGVTMAGGSTILLMARWAQAKA